MSMASRSIPIIIGVSEMAKPTIRCPICNKWKMDSIDAGPCDKCQDDGANLAADTGLTGADLDAAIGAAHAPESVEGLDGQPHQE